MNALATCVAVSVSFVDDDGMGLIGSLPNWEGALVFVVNVLLDGFLEKGPNVNCCPSSDLL